jgi:hypothetical protein
VKERSLSIFRKLENLHSAFEVYNKVKLAMIDVRVSKTGHFYFGENRIFLNWCNMAG